MGLKLSRALINVVDVAKFVPLYTDILGFEITDRGHSNDKTPVVFLSQDAQNRRQIVIANSPLPNRHRRDADGIG